jgi:putative ABC transport system permease protein
MGTAVVSRRHDPGTGVRKNQKVDGRSEHRAVSAYLETTAQFGPAAGGSVRVVSALFLGLAGMVLLLACVNVGSALLARATARRREMALRAALGGTRTRLVRQMLTESLLLAAFGGAAGIFVGVWSSVALSSMPLQFGLPLLLDFSFDGRVFACAFVATIVAGFVVGIVPALRASRQSIDAVLHESASSGVSGRQRMRRGLIRCARQAIRTR